MKTPNHKTDDIQLAGVNVRPESVDFVDIYQRLFQYYGPQNWWPANHAFEVIVGAILTQNTAWRNVEIALDNMRSQDLFSWRSLLEISVDDLQFVIRPAGFYRRKAACILSICRWLEGQQGIEQIKQHNTIEIRKTLINIKGIGSETADAILLYAFDKPAFVIDKYTHRIVCRLTGKELLFNYQALQNGFVNQLDGEVTVFQEYHALIVAHAKNHCKKAPNCTACPLNNSCRHYQCKLQG